MEHLKFQRSYVRLVESLLTVRPSLQSCYWQSPELMCSILEAPESTKFWMKLIPAVRRFIRPFKTSCLQLWISKSRRVMNPNSKEFRHLLVRALSGQPISWSTLERRASQVILFGSRAVGVARIDSDWDLLCVGEGMSIHNEKIDLNWIST